MCQFGYLADEDLVDLGAGLGSLLANTITTIRSASSRAPPVHTGIINMFLSNHSSSGAKAVVGTEVIATAARSGAAVADAAVADAVVADAAVCATVVSSCASIAIVTVSCIGVIVKDSVLGAVTVRTTPVITATAVERAPEVVTVAVDVMAAVVGVAVVVIATVVASTHKIYALFY